MISQIANAIHLNMGNSTQPALVDDIKPQKSPAPIELPQQAVQATEKVDINTARAAAEQINKLVQQFNHDLQFTVDEETGTHVVKVIDNQTKDVIRQMPTEEMLAIAKALEKLQGLLIKDKV